MAVGLLKQAPSGRAGVRLGGLTWGVCSGTRRREAPCGKRPAPMSREAVLGVRPSTNSPDRVSIDPPPFLGNTENWVLWTDCYERAKGRLKRVPLRPTAPSHGGCRARR